MQRAVANLRATVVLVIDSTSDECLVTRPIGEKAAGGPANKRVGGDVDAGYVLDYGVCSSVVARAVKAPRRRVLVAGIPKLSCSACEWIAGMAQFWICFVECPSDVDIMAGLSADSYAASDSTSPPLGYGESALLVEFLDEEPGEDAGAGREATAVDLQCKLLQLLNSFPQSAFLSKLAVTRCFVPRTPIAFPATTTHSLVPVPHKLRRGTGSKAADEGARKAVEVKGQLGYVDPVQKAAIEYLDDDLNHLRTPVTYRVARRRISRSSARCARKWQRVVQRLRFRHLFNTLDASHLTRGPAPANIPTGGQPSDHKRGDEAVRMMQSMHLAGAESGGRKGRDFARSGAFADHDDSLLSASTRRPGEHGPGALQMIVDERGRAQASRPGLRDLISMPTGSAADGSEVFDGVYLWKKFESRKFGLPFWHNQETGQTTWSCPAVRPT